MIYEDEPTLPSDTLIGNAPDLENMNWKKVFKAQDVDAVEQARAKLRKETKNKKVTPGFVRSCVDMIESNDSLLVKHWKKLERALKNVKFHLSYKVIIKVHILAN